jgi:PAS domain S-box-containing protein
MLDVSHPLFAEAPDGILIVGVDGIVQAANDAANEMFGFETLTGVSVDDLVPPDLRTEHAPLREGFVSHPRARRMGQGALNLRGLRSDGSTFPVDIALTPIDGDSVAAVVRDLTDLERTWRRLDEQESTLAILEDRERIARDTHDTVIQEVFAAGLKLNAVASRLDMTGQADATSSVRDIAGSLDETIDRLRRTIFDIRQALPGHVADEVRTIVADMTQGSGLEEVDVRVAKKVERLTPRAVEHLLSTVREAVANVVKHAQATQVSVTVRVSKGWCTLEVIDDGVGLSVTGDPGFGLENMRRRSETLGGSFIAAADTEGTRLEWRIPL